MSLLCPVCPWHSCSGGLEWRKGLKQLNIHFYQQCGGKIPEQELEDLSERLDNKGLLGHTYPSRRAKCTDLILTVLLWLCISNRSVGLLSGILHPIPPTPLLKLGFETFRVNNNVCLDLGICLSLLSNLKPLNSFTHVDQGRVSDQITN